MGGRVAPFAQDDTKNEVPKSEGGYAKLSRTRRGEDKYYMLAELVG